MARFKGRRSKPSHGFFALISLFLVTLVTFLQAIIDWLQSLSQGSYMPRSQQILIAVVAILAFSGFLFSLLANRAGGKSPFL